MVQVLHLSNGNTINEKLADKKGRVVRLLKANLPDDEIITQAFLAALCRHPTDAEKKRLGDVVALAFPNEKHVYLEDMVWGILSSREFLFNH